MQQRTLAPSENKGLEPKTDALSYSPRNRCLQQVLR